MGVSAPWVRLILIIVLCDLDSFAFAVVEMGAAKKPPFKGFFMGIIVLFLLSGLKWRKKEKNLNYHINVVRQDLHL